MAYFPDFNNDLFTSFAHADNPSKCVDPFTRRLAERLAELRGIDIASWRDLTLDESDVLSNEVFNQLKSCALVISIVSLASIITSPWCRKEPQEFERSYRSNGGLQTGNRIRSANVVKAPPDNGEHCSLSDTLGFEFYVPNKQTGRIRDLDPSSQDFKDRLEDLVQNMPGNLRDINRRPASAPSMSAFDVFLGHNVRL